MRNYKNILVAPLNWGLGHATRCIPIINAIIDNGDRPIIASDGDALNLLKKEFPTLTFIELPSYEISYQNERGSLKLKLIKDSPRIWQAIRSEHKALQHLIIKYKLDGIISDNRLGLYTNLIPTVFITHQLQVLSGGTTWLSTQLHLHYIKKFDQCWIPDVKSYPNLSGKLSYNEDSDLKKIYLGPLSRFVPNNAQSHTYDLMVLLSGPEPQKSILERRLKKECEKFNGKVLFISGKVEKEQTIVKSGHITYCNYLDTQGLQKAFDRSKLILSRSGYTTVMDLQKLKKKAFFIPTPGQFEQEYLAEHLQKAGFAPYCNQDEFDINMLKMVDEYKGLVESYSSTTSISSSLDEAFSRVNENSEPIPNSLST
ncbi:glycosyltransferase [Nonlabens tegetincola]|uniref:glycosyltransferase n=1 Tax=Nonlabens tegetincola TaxID=323273 RepID=UPI000CF37412|nr:glycosyltransferase [Nonlabens tegetincola]PQJ18995.1 glycosyltransferase [Nonlabens tegetincola]